MHIPDQGTLILGAPDIILDQDRRADGHSGLMELVSQYAEKGKRVVLFAFSGQKPSQVSEEAGCFDAALPEDIAALALIIIDEKIRPKARETFEFFRDQGVDIKVISGDNPVTVSRIACEAGIENAHIYADASDFGDEELARSVSEYTVIGRVRPDQKLTIVKALQEQGRVVAMTGDGANDVLALRASDCSIAMQTGTDAARYAANIVLLDSDFSSMPLIVAQGRQSINNLQRSAALYLTKTAYSFIFAVFFIFATFISYPFENIQVTLIGAVTIGLPSFILALEPNNERVTGHFLKNVFGAALPAGILEAAALIISLFILKKTFGADPAQLSSAATYLMMILGIIVVIRISGKFRLWKIGLVLLLAAIACGAVLIFPALFSLAALPSGMWMCILITAAAFAAVYALASVVLKSAARRFC